MFNTRFWSVAIPSLAFAAGCESPVQYDGSELEAETPTLANCTAEVTSERETSIDDVTVVESQRTTTTYNADAKVASELYLSETVETGPEGTSETSYSVDTLNDWDGSCRVREDKTFDAEDTRISTFACNEQGDPIQVNVHWDFEPESITYFQWAYIYDDQQRMTQQTLSKVFPDTEEAMIQKVESVTWDGDFVSERKIDWEGDNVWDETSRYTRTVDEQDRVTELVENGLDYVRTTQFRFTDDTPWATSWTVLTEPIPSAEPLEQVYTQTVSCAD